MKASITDSLIKKLKGQNVTVFDTGQPGLILRLRATGVHTYRVALGRGQQMTLGKQDHLSVDAARKLARNALTERDKGKDPIAEKRKRRAATLEAFLDGDYATWARANQKHADEWMTRVKRAFPELLSKRLPEITSFVVEKWRSARHAAGVRRNTTNRDLDTLRTVLSKAVEWNIIPAHPLRAVKRAKVDVLGRLRYLSADEEKRLRQALTAREQRNREARASFNRWRSERGYKTVPDYPPDRYTDHLQPVVLLALNTGLRRGEILGLEWRDLDLVANQVTVRGTKAKSGITRHVPLNAEAVKVLTAWKVDSANDDDLVFPGPDGKPMQDLKTAWLHLLKDAKISGFTFHDLRHSFASKLVQAGVDLNTVRELLGHADIKMTLRYSHLAPEHRAAAVAKLVAAG